MIVNLIAFPEGVAGSGWKKKQLKKKAGIPSLRERLAARYLRKEPEATPPGMKP